MSGRKKLKDLFVDLKIPRELRSSTPLLVSEKGVLWVFPYRTSELAKVDETTRQRLLVRWEPAP
jgi:tRNA(Ile)-lysidine synthase